jgi:enamine deaminase RidA (YjgF/YER057c/UK114 family)
MIPAGARAELIIPASMRVIYEQYGYAPAIRVGRLVFCAGQVGRTQDLRVIEDVEAQFEAAWDNLSTVLSEAGCGFADVIDLTTYHVGMETHFALFKTVKDRRFPRGFAAWTAIGVAALSRPGLLLEIKATALLAA